MLSKMGSLEKDTKGEGGGLAHRLGVSIGVGVQTCTVWLQFCLGWSP